METKEIAEKLVGLCREGKDNECLELYAEEAVSIEATASPGSEREFKGKEAIKGKQAWWYEHFEVKGGTVSGPYVHDNRFAVHFEMEILTKESGKTESMKEVGLYHVENGRIIKEEFFY